MNIVWIEDFGGEQSSAKHLAGQIFGPLCAAAEAIPISDWMAENDELEFSGKLLEEYFIENIPEHRVTLVTNVNAYLDLCRTDDVVEQFDIFILDINLTRDSLPGSPLPIPDAFAGSADFHRRGGLYIYNHLLARRFPKQRICLMTGEDTTLKEYEHLCVEALVEPPWRFHKSEQSNGHGFSEFHLWLSNLTVDSHYLRFRRGALNGLAWARKEAVLHFRGYFKRAQKDYFSPNDAHDYLNSLDALLPSDVSAEKQASIMRLFLRALVHEWEDRAKPAEKKHVLLAHATGNVMKLARNCLTHGRLLDSATPQDLAILFIFNFRAMFGAPMEALRDYERDLLTLFDAELICESQVEPKLVGLLSMCERDLETCVTYSDVSLLGGKLMKNRHDPRPDGKVEPFTFFDVIKEMSMAAKPSNLRFAKLVVATFWLTVFEKDRQWPYGSAMPCPVDWVVYAHNRAFAHYFGGGATLNGSL